MKTFGRIKGIVWFFLFLISIDVVTYALVVDDTGTPGRYILHHFYAREDNIDTLFLGTSHTMYGIDPDIYEEITGNKAYNCGTNWQYINGSFALLKEADQLYDLKHVYVDLYFSVCRMPNRDELTSEQLKSTYYISDFMKPSLNKYSYILSGSNASHYIEGLIPQRRYIKNITDFAYVRNTLEKKKSMNCQNYILESGLERIREDGQTACESSLKNQGFFMKEYIIRYTTYRKNGMTGKNVLWI